MLVSTLKNDEILSVKHLKKHYPIRGGIFNKVTDTVKAVDNVSFSVKRGETFSIVGESGCGKTTTGMCLTRLVKPTSGDIVLNGKSIVDKNQVKNYNFHKDVQIIFQDPYSSLNPKMKIRQIIQEPLYGTGSRAEIDKRVSELANMVGLSTQHLDRYPHEFSGGQRQRIGIARALALNPKLIICDEPVSALDVSIQSQVLNLLNDLQDELGLTYIFISHDLSVVQHISDRIAVMYLGKIVEIGSADEIFSNPRHPYTKALLSSIPVPDVNVAKDREKIILKGDVPSPRKPPSGCAFHTRCAYKEAACSASLPTMFSLRENHAVACHLVERGDL